MSRDAKPTPLLQGTLDLLLLKALSAEPRHGLGVSRRVEQITAGAFRVTPGSLFPALHRLEEQGWLTSVWGESENRRRAKYYRLTAAGRRQLADQTANWETFVKAMAKVLRSSAPQPA
jgi:transcriptional regulator